MDDEFKGLLAGLEQFDPPIEVQVLVDFLDSGFSDMAPLEIADRKFVVLNWLMDKGSELKPYLVAYLEKASDSLLEEAKERWPLISDVIEVIDELTSED